MCRDGDIDDVYNRAVIKKKKKLLKVMMMGIVMIGAVRSRKEKKRGEGGGDGLLGREGGVCGVRCSGSRVKGFPGQEEGRRRWRCLETRGEDRKEFFLFFLRMLSLDGGDVLYDGVGSCGG